MAPLISRTRLVLSQGRRVKVLATSHQQRRARSTFAAWVTDDDDGAVWKLGWPGAVVAVVMTACGTPSAVTATQASTSLPTQGEVAPTTTGIQQSREVLRRIGEPFLLGNFQLTMVSVQDPFPSVPLTEPAAGNRLISIEYEVVNRSTASLELSHPPGVELLDSIGAAYKSEHGRVSLSGGSGAPGQLAPDKKMDSSRLFEVPTSATGLRVVFRSDTSSGAESAVVTLD